MRVYRKNNVQVSGELKDFHTNDEFAQLLLENPIPIVVIIPLTIWNKFNFSHPEEKNLSLSGVLDKENKTNEYVVKIVNDNSISCFHNLLGNEAETTFSGSVILKKKFDFNTDSKMYLKRMIFETIDFEPITFEAVAIRSIVSYFDNIEEGTKLKIKASFTLSKDGLPPYWRITNKPIIVS